MTAPSTTKTTATTRSSSWNTTTTSNYNHSPQINKNDNDFFYDVVIVGAGPAGLACLSAIQEPYSLDQMNEHQIHRAARHLHNNNKSNDQLHDDDRRHHHSRKKTVAVIDGHDTWMTGWRQNFQTLDIQYLRSPAMAHPDMFDQHALLAFAAQQQQYHDDGDDDDDDDYDDDDDN